MKEIKKTCETCEFNFGNICAGYGINPVTGGNTYGMEIEETKKLFPNGCDDYNISLDSFIDKEKKEVENDLQ